MNALQEPRNASELHYLATATEGMPTMRQRLDALAYLHAQGRTLPDTTATAESRVAWADRERIEAQTKARNAAAAAPALSALRGPLRTTAAPKAGTSGTPTRARAAAAKAAPQGLSYADRLRASLKSNRLTPAARSRIEAELSTLERSRP